MSESGKDKFKYGLLRIIDVSGFRVFDPVVRLLFGEEPRQQTADIFRYLITPMAFVGLCLVLWTVIAPRHKTRSGEVPTPAQVWTAFTVNDVLDERENEKQSDFEVSGAGREALIQQVEAELQQQTERSNQMQQRLTAVETAVAEEIQRRIAPLQEKYEQLREAHRSLQALRNQQIENVAADVANNSAMAEKLLSLLRSDEDLRTAEKEKEKAVRERITEFRASQPRVLREARADASMAANTVQHLTKRLDYLREGNRSVRGTTAVAAASQARTELSAASTPADVLAAARKVVSSERVAERTAEQEYPRTATIWFQVKRSLFTVFVGFVLAAIVAIPVGIMCGLNKVVMACLTPLISIFKPVSPVVWLLIFQIVVGAFFPDPENHGLFLFLGTLPGIGSLDVNPALVFSACTVAMCALWPALVNTALGVSSIDEDHMNVARVLKLGLWSRLYRIVIPSSLPLVFAGLRISLGVGWMVLIAAEALSSSNGLGKFVWDEYQNGSSHSFANIIFACFVVGLIGFLLDRVMILLQRSVSFDDGAAVV
ncbi:MAG: hypothetical protein Fues2KO_12750 [Fuerstiella sp.]